MDQTQAANLVNALFDGIERRAEAVGIEGNANKMIFMKGYMASFLGSIVMTGDNLETALKERIIQIAMMGE